LQLAIFLLTQIYLSVVLLAQTVLMASGALVEVEEVEAAEVAPFSWPRLTEGLP
jgi:hypothetical protein